MTIGITLKSPFAYQISVTREGVNESMFSLKCFYLCSRNGRVIVFGFFVVFVMTYYYLGVKNDFLKPKMKLTEKLTENSLNRYLINTSGCHIPNLDPFDESVLKYYKYWPPYECSKRKPLVESNQTSIRIVKSELSNYNVKNLMEFFCGYAEFLKTPDPQQQLRMSKKYFFYGINRKHYKFDDSVNIYSEFIQVLCYYKKQIIYEDFHAFVIPKKPKFRIDPIKVNDNVDNVDKLSVIILGVDSLSRLNYLRQMPKTNEYIKSLNPFVFFGYNKVGENTFPNLVPMLSGYSVDDLTKICWFNTSDHFDKCPWIWKNFSAQNYLTAFIQDSVNVGLFTYIKKGFIEQPTDYYLDSYMHVNEKEIGNGKEGFSYFCIGNRLVTDVILDYANKFILNMTYSNKKYWGFFWASTLTHDFFNVPANNDMAFLNIFKSIVNNKILNNTMLIFMSDHGLRWGSIRETFSGRIEEHLPFLHIFLPEWFKKKYSTAVKYMKENAYKLTTHFDLHETMKDLLNLNSLKDENLKLRILNTRNDRGISLFLPIPDNRTCESAGIGVSWCTCNQIKKISITNKNVQKAVKLTVEHINSLLQNYTYCAKLSLDKILTASLSSTNELLVKKSKYKISDFIVSFLTTPGYGKFESTVRHLANINKMTVIGSVVRINSYGDQSRCVNNSLLKLYCFCI